MKLREIIKTTIHEYLNESKSYDDNIKIKGSFNNEPFNVTIIIGNNEYEINIHPFDSMGGI
jgi:hypothetical protein